MGTVQEHLCRAFEISQATTHTAPTTKNSQCSNHLRSQDDCHSSATVRSIPIL